MRRDNHNPAADVMVEIGGKPYLASVLRAKPRPLWLIKDVAQHKKDGDEARCLCSGRPGLLLLLKGSDDVGGQSGDGTARSARRKSAHLATPPFQGDQHASFCPFVGEPDAGSEVVNRAAVRKRPDGTTELAAEFSFIRFPRTTGPNDESPDLRGERVRTGSQNTLRLSGVLNCMLSAIGFNEWNPSADRPRDNQLFANLLQNEASRTTVNKSLLSKNAYIPRSCGTSGANFDLFSNDWPAFLQTLQAPQPNNGVRCGLFIGEVLGLCRNEDEWHLEVEGHPGGLPLTEARVKSLKRRFRSASLAIGQRATLNARVLTIALVSCKDDGLLEVEDIALVLTNGEYVPSVSHHEVRVANKLVEQKRHFRKPLSRKKGYPFLHDFELLDVGSVPLPMEVWGMHGLRYDMQKLRKILYCMAHGIELWHWCAADRDPMPEFPAPRH